VGDIGTDISQAIVGGLLPSQYDDAKNVAKQVKSAIGNAPLFLTGHSLGGGLASAAALEAQSPAVTFNAAGLNGLTEAFSGPIFNFKSVVNYSVDGEFLSTSQKYTFLPEAYGTLYRIQPAAQDENTSALNKHGIDVVLRALNQ
jgi:acetyl esterase/lipase